MLDTADLKLIRGEINRAVKKYATVSTIGFLLLVGGGVYNFHNTATRGNGTRGLICRLIQEGDVSFYQFHKEGTINLAQLKRGLVASAHDRQQLLPAKNCPTGITPPPPGLEP